MAKQEIPSFTEPAKSDAPEVMKAAPVPSVVLQNEFPELDPEAPPTNMFSGVMPKLAVYGKNGSDPRKPVAGHELYWFSDENNGLMLSNALQSGWRFVSREEIALNDALVGPGNNDLGDRVRRWVGSGSDNMPVHNYLMKIPDWLYTKHMAARERVHLQQEEQLAMGTYKVDDMQHTYTANRPAGAAPGASTGLSAIKIGRYYQKPQT